MLYKKTNVLKSNQFDFYWLDLMPSKGADLTDKLARFKPSPLTYRYRTFFSRPGFRVEDTYMANDREVNQIASHLGQLYSKFALGLERAPLYFQNVQDCLSTQEKGHLVFMTYSEREHVACIAAFKDPLSEKDVYTMKGFWRIGAVRIVPARIAGLLLLLIMLGVFTVRLFLDSNNGEAFIPLFIAVGSIAYTLGEYLFNKFILQPKITQDYADMLPKDPNVVALMGGDTQSTADEPSRLCLT